MERTYPQPRLHLKPGNQSFEIHSLVSECLWVMLLHFPVWAARTPSYLSLLTGLPLPQLWLFLGILCSQSDNVGICKGLEAATLYPQGFLCPGDQPSDERGFTWPLTWPLFFLCESTGFE